MHPSVLEVESGVLHSFDGTTHDVHGGAYLPPETYLATSAELERLREQQAADGSRAVPALLLAGSLLCFAAGYWLGRRGAADED